MAGPLGALPALSPAARRALTGSVALAVADTLVRDNHGLPLLLGMALGWALSGFFSARSKQST